MKIYIHTNNKQLIGALVAKTLWQEKGFQNVEILNMDDSGSLETLWGKNYLRGGAKAKFDQNDLQSFTISRFEPEALGVYPYLVTDPDVFPVSDNLHEKFKEIEDLGWNGLHAVKYEKGFHSSVFFRTGEDKKLWNFEKLLQALINQTMDYNELMLLHFVENKIKPIDEHFNSFDKMTKNTLLLHNTGRVTQPWKEGLPIDFVNHKQLKKKSIRSIFSPKNLFRKKKVALYQKHPDEKQIRFFLEGLKLAMKKGNVSPDYLKVAVKNRYVRTDIVEQLERIL